MNKKIQFISTFFLFVMIMFYSTGGVSQDVINLWPGEVPGEEKPKAPAVLSENKSDNVTRISEVTDPLLEVFEPDESVKNGVGVIIFPGGGYYILAVEHEGYEVAQYFADLGYTAFVLQYRVPQKQQGALMDAQRALRIVRERATHWGIDKNKIGVLGFSAGGSLAARALTLYDQKTYDNIDKTDEYSAKPNFAVMIYPAYLDKGENRSLTPELKVDSLVGPAFLFATADDKHANSSLVMAQALRNAGAKVELHLLPVGGHGYGLRKGKRAAETWPVYAHEWLKEFILD